MSRMPDGVAREAVIDVGAIEHNVRHLRALTASEVIAVVKADGYGHGAERSARAALAGGAARLATADVPEALALRSAGIDAPLLAWLHAPNASFQDAAAARIELGVSSVEQVRAAAAAGSRERPVRVQLKVETGLGRNGIAPSEYGTVFGEAARFEREGLIEVIGVFSHLSNTSPEDDRTALSRFTVAQAAAESAGLHPPLRHIAASHAAIDMPEARLGCVRLGVAIYGLSPFADRSSADLGLRPAMTLRGAVAAVRRVPAGQGVSYGYLHRTVAESTLALVAMGYADGVPRAASGAGPVVIGDRRFTVAGRIAMDQFVVDVGDAPVEVGDEAVLFGDPAVGAPAASDWADAAGTINYEIVTRVGPRVPRREVRS
ncbi:alanine racemase [Microbacterium sp. EYE_5]|uniref:alanine racemase n=1 Tax=unclassified Microbacterium TaxID=2609290 RepID=UPI0020057F33|nr:MULTISPECIES: alanine racemase [unclassified Microbacterium]MCK6079014.1 alanine racemase [Microbacterium sp. EYE_382]MCK6084284.1 alanine racemase [Microbacterium sp. EYE_384]MCK6123487.1 alanine racemase [Microbacterium sp. EYE_80]MCK6125048.1 alanine racemase [Microbacterium sp. EYE_79]MCK6142878.1 alanine racemase [Microbacterium sp. EYE_39]